MSGAFSMAKPYKWIENIKREVTDGVWFNVDDISNLAGANIEELNMYHSEIQKDGYLDMISMGIMNIINWWENETHVDD